VKWRIELCSNLIHGMCATRTSLQADIQVVV
jgi:hypothetical protein